MEALTGTNVALLTVYAMGRADQTYLMLAWLYVLFRVLHTAVHTTYNNVLHRLTVFLTSIALLGAIWVRIGTQVLAA